MSVYSNWKYFFDSFWKFVSRNSYPIVLVLFFIWICIGIFPLTCYESDSMHVIAGCNIMYNQGLTFPPVYSYLYEMQPLVTYTVVGFKYVFPFLTCEQIYCLLSAICGALFIVESVNFVYRITSFRKIFILLSLFLIPESFAISMYPNSAIFAAVFFVCALNRLLDGKFYVAMVLMVIAPLYRIDILIVYPVVFYNPQIQISEKSQTKRLKIADSRKTKRPIIDKRTTPNKRHSNAIITLRIEGFDNKKRGANAPLFLLQ